MRLAQGHSKKRAKSIHLGSNLGPFRSRIQNYHLPKDQPPIQTANGANTQMNENIVTDGENLSL